MIPYVIPALGKQKSKDSKRCVTRETHTQFHAIVYIVAVLLLVFFAQHTFVSFQWVNAWR